MVLRTILFILMTKNLQSHASGFDAYSSCYRTSRKRQELPCDFGSQTWCNIPGNSYPWHAVRQFVHENQGLMRRMYGDERHISVLRAELENNDIELGDNVLIKEEFRRRYSKDIDRTKEFVKILKNSDNGKLLRDLKAHKGIGKVQEKYKKSIDDTSHNVLYKSNVKESKDDALKKLSINKYNNKTSPQILATTAPTSTISHTSSNTVETTYETFTSGTTTNYPTTTTTTTTTTTMTTAFATDPENSTEYQPTDPTVEPTTQEEEAQYNLTTSTVSSNDSQYDEIYDYDAETEEPPTTLSLDLSTSEAYVEEEDFKKHKSDNDEHIVEKTQSEKEEATKKPSLSEFEPSPVLRLKGINACPVKEEVVAPFWANNTRGEVLALLNLYPFEQYVHWEKCMYEHKQMFCREGCRCEQQYRLHRLLAYDPNNECRGIFSDWFRFPSCCVCKCYNLPLEFRLTSRSPRFQEFDIYEKSKSQFSSKSSFSALNEFAQHQPQQWQWQP